jgi:tripartite-type tricarboxylate transporter receptor subunit TctC
MYPAWIGGVMLAVLALGATGAAPASAAGYPDKPISLVEPYPAGSISDIGARVLARQLSTELGHPVRVVDAPGANTAVGASKLQQDSAEGYTIFWDIVSQLAYVIASKELPYDAADFQGVAMLGGESYAVIARADDKRFATVADLVSWAKAHPGALSVANSGDGDSKKALDELQAAAQIKANSIPYSGGSTILTSVLGGHVDVGITAPSNVTNNDKLRVVMVLTTAKIYPPLPASETAGSAGYAVDAPLLRGIFVKKGTPPAVVSTLADATQKALQSPEWHDFSKKFSQIEAPDGPGAADKSLQDEVARWQPYLKGDH